MSQLMIDATSGAAIRRDDEVITNFYQIGVANNPIDPSEWYYRGLLYFPLTSLPATAKILSAKVEIYKTANLGTLDTKMYAFMVTEEWVSGQVTRSVRKTGVSWSDFGGSFDATKSIALTGWIYLSSGNGWVIWDFTSDGLQLLKDIKNGVKANYGLIFKTTEGGTQAFGFDYATNKPRLVIDYTTSGGHKPQSWFF